MQLSKFQLAANEGVGICQLLTQMQLTKSNGEGKRLVEGMAIEVNGEKIKDPQFKVALKSGEKLVIKAGKKKFARVVVQ